MVVCLSVDCLVRLHINQVLERSERMLVYSEKGDKVTLRDLFALAVAAQEDCDDFGSMKEYARYVWRAADAIMVERTKGDLTT